VDDRDATGTLQRLASRNAHLCVAAFGTKEDLEHDLAVHFLERSAKYDPNRASMSTFLCTISNRRIASMLRCALAARRDCRRTVPLSAVVPRIEDSDVLTLGHYVAASWARIENQDLRVDLARVLEKLPVELAKIAHVLFDGESVGDAARKLGISRATAHRRLNQLRRHLDAAGLRAYIAGPRRESET